MRKLLLVTFLLSCAPLAKPSTIPSPTAILDASVAISVLCPDGSMWVGSGVAIGPDRVLTARHVVDCDGVPPYLMAVETNDDQSYKAGVVELAREGVDVALIAVYAKDATPLPYVRVAASPQRPTGNVCLYSANPHKTWRYQCGHITGWLDGEVVEWADGTSNVGNGMLTYNNMSEPGTSGSGVFNAQGELIGIHVGKNAKIGLAWWVGEFRNLL